VSDEYSGHLCHDCSEELYQRNGDWLCPECGEVDDFELVPNRDKFIV